MLLKGAVKTHSSFSTNQKLIKPNYGSLACFPILPISDGCMFPNFRLQPDDFPGKSG